MNVPVILRRRRFQYGGGVVPFSPSTLFASGEEGAWYEPSTTTCFTATWTGSAFTDIAAAGYGDLVAIMEDQSGNGNDATQTDSSKRPILARVPETGRRNLLERTEEFDDAVWTLSGLLAFGSGSVVNATATTDPVGGNTAELITENSSTSAHSIYGTGFSVTSGQAYSVSFYAKANGRQYVSVRGQNAVSPANYPWATFDMTNVTSAHNAAASASSITSVGNGWYRCTMSWTSNTTVTGANAVIALSNSSAAPATNNTLGTSYAGDGTSGIYIWGAQLEAASSATAYQKVVDQYDITEAGVTSLEYLAFDGSDDFMALPNIPFSSDTGFNAFMGADTSDLQSDYRIAFSRTADNGVNSAGPYFGGETGGNSYKPNIFDQSSSKAVNVVTRGKAVFAWQVSLTSGSTRTAITRVNQAQVSTSYSRTLTSNEVFTGLNSTVGVQMARVNIYSVILRCAAPLTAQEISDTETYLAAKTGVTIP